MQPVPPPPPPPNEAGWPPPPYILPQPQGPYGAKRHTPIGTIVLILIAAAASFMVQQAVLPMLLGPPGPGGEAHASVGLEAGTWDAFAITITVATTNTGAIRAPELSFEVQGANGIPYFEGSSGITATVNGIQTTVTYRDANADGWLATGDTMRLRVDPTTSIPEFHGGLFRLKLGTAVLGAVTIP